MPQAPQVPLNLGREFQFGRAGPDPGGNLLKGSAEHQRGLPDLSYLICGFDHPDAADGLGCIDEIRLREGFAQTQVIIRREHINLNADPAEIPRPFVRQPLGQFFESRERDKSLPRRFNTGAADTLLNQVYRLSLRRYAEHAGLHGSRKVEKISVLEDKNRVYRMILHPALQAN
jgi:hypothetical protein